MNLDTALTHFVDENYPRIGECYGWSFDVDQMPVASSLSGTSWYEKNLALRSQLHTHWKCADLPLREKIAHFYIAIWGRVRSNHQQTISDYARMTPTDLIARNTQGVASWSKLLSVQDPAAYAIYDARVAAALNVLQLLHCDRVFTLFPLLASQNRRVTSVNRQLKIHARATGATFARASFYHDYLQLLGHAAQHSIHRINLQQVEMLLFALAEDLIEKWMSRQLAVGT